MEPPTALTWRDRLVDALRSRGTALFLAGLALGWLLFANPFVDRPLTVTLHNDTDVLIESVWLDFGHGLSQSNLYEGQLRPGERRGIALNHPPGAGFNMKVRYADGESLEFCANRGVEGRRQTVRLYR
ncbi:hypothetical protein B1C78_00695 [Thioalkalivibrio denitrificans]|uniref:Uncharacterized protein n=1 Tax=Thioalkalivibrio denitrificans TaxID=108003 RepID=A0A1V3NVJ8_9GAMM|nr:hypothetical protein [Thioalkalivibrio denitrificans]OOG28746.1 hypothetical protein B1C78_00695 [Thioalkalivibrio denitrificans]